MNIKEKVVCIIPARGGSKGIANKNIRIVNGKPLIAHTIEQSLNCNQITRTIVTTDSDVIADVARRFGAEVVRRSAELANDIASSESALIDALNQLEKFEHYNPDIVVFLQCTAPLRSKHDLANAIAKYKASGSDTLLSVVRSHRFLWTLGVDGFAKPINYSHTRRPRRQDFENQYQENGSIYIFRPWGLLSYNNRLHGSICLYEMAPESAVDIDDEHDFLLCEALLQQTTNTDIAAHLPKRVKLIVLDFDGVLTDNRVWTSESGQESVACDRSDGLGLAKIQAKGIDLIVLSTEANPVVAARCSKLRLTHFQNVKDKGRFLSDYLDKRGLSTQEVIYAGNDENDLECMRYVECSVAPADAQPCVLSIAKIVLKSAGGRGAVRELCELIISNGE